MKLCSLTGWLIHKRNPNRIKPTFLSAEVLWQPA